MNVVKVSEGIKSYINTLVDDLAVNDFLIGAVRPMIRMAIENNFYKVNNILKVLADKNGDIDFNKLVDETMTSMLNGKQATYPIGNFAIAEFGNNALKVTIPMINKFFKFESQDFIKMKNFIIQNYS